MKKAMKESITDYYKGDKQSDGVSLAWNSIFLEVTFFVYYALCNIFISRYHCMFKNGN